MSFSLADIQRFFAPVKNMIYGVVGRAILTAVNNSTKTQMVQVQMFGDDVFELERLQEYGFENYPDPADANNEAVFLAIGGNRGLAFVVRTNNRELRPKTLAAGEVMMYSQFGQKIHLKADGSVLIDAGAHPISLVGSGIDLKAAGGTAVMLETIISKLNDHTHSTVVPTHGTIKSNTMKIDGTELIAGTDSAANVKAKA